MGRACKNRGQINGVRRYSWKGVFVQKFNHLLFHFLTMARYGLQGANMVISRALRIRPSCLPVLLMFVTDRCNLRCAMCGVCEHQPPPGSGGELTTAEWCAVIDSAKALGTNLISISGGEPLVRPDIAEIIAYARSKGIAVHICTNGVLLNEAKARALKAAQVNTVSISLDSFSPELHEALRGPNTFARTVENIKRLHALAPEICIGINYLITRTNYRRMPEMIAFAESLGAQQIKFAPIHTNLLHREKESEIEEQLVFRPEELADLEAEMVKLKAALKQTALVSTSTAFLDGVTRLYSQPKKFRCYAGYATCAVNPYGYLSACADMAGPLSVRERPLEAIFKSKAFEAQRACVRKCTRACWDTTNTELSLRLQPASLLAELKQTWRDIRFYYPPD